MNLVPEAPTNRLEFLVHGDLRITSLASKQMDSYNIQQKYNPFGLDTAYVQFVKIESNRKVVAGDSIPLSWQYRGEFKNDHFQLGPSAFYKGWADLEVGSLWLPTLSNLQHQFHAEVSVTVPDQYTVVGAGSIGKDESQWQVESTEPSIDFPLIISDEMLIDHERSETIELSVYHTGVSDELIDFVPTNTFKVMKYYKQLFGDGHQKTTLRVVVPPSTRARDQAYARPQLIVLSHSSKPNTDTFEFIAHEAGHLWWLNAANTQSKHNFMNEAFAEWTLRNNRQLSYYKGSYLLYQLHNRIGEEYFLKFLRSLLKKQNANH